MRHCPHCSDPTIPLAGLVLSSKRRPIRCRSCGEFSYLPPWAKVPAYMLVELAVVGGLVFSLWYQTSLLFVGLMLVPVLAVLITLLLCPLSLVRRDPGTISFRAPSRFSS